MNLKSKYLITTISFSLAKLSKDTKIEIYNLKGQKVKALSSHPLGSGRYKFTWDGLDKNNKHLASGMYLYQISRGKFSVIKKTMLIR